MWSKLGCWLGMVLMLLAFVFLFAAIVIPSLPSSEGNTTVTRLFGPLLCKSGEEAVQQSVTQSDLRGTVHSVVLTCVSEDGTRRDVSNGLFVLGAIGFSVPFVGGLLLTMIALGVFARNKARQVINDPQAVLAQLGIEPPTPAIPHSPPGQAGAGYGAPAVTLVDRLRQLEQARNQGLITTEEYERARQKLLDGDF